MQSVRQEDAAEQHAAVPACIGFIMDGNRRWARERELPTLKGHQAGYETFRAVARWCKELGISHLVVYAFSTENWNRAQEEVGYLLELMRKLLSERIEEQQNEGAAIHIVGDLSRFPDDIQASINELHARNPDEPTRHVWICASYGGRDELVHAATALATSGETITEESFANHLLTAGMPDPDIIVRTGGQQRLSNFLLWQGAYSELFFLNTYWPDFSRDELLGVLHEYAHRVRNYGK